MGLIYSYAALLEFNQKKLFHPLGGGQNPLKLIFFVLLEFEFVLSSSTILSLNHTDERARKERMIYFKQAREFKLLAKKKTEYKHCYVGLLEITPSISEKPACSRTKEEMINK